MNYKAILFDFDGVAFAGTLFSARLKNDYGTEYEAMQPFFKNEFKQCSVGKADLKEILPSVIKTWKWPGTADELLTYWAKDDAIEPSILDCITKLRANGVRCFIATNQEKYRAASLREKFGHGKVFEEIFCSAEIGYTKNNPAFWESVTATLSPAITDRPQVLLIDDDEGNVNAARAFGLSAIHYRGIEDIAGL